MLKTCLIVFLFLSSLYVHAQRVQGGLRVNYGMTKFSNKGSNYDALSYELEGKATPGFGVQLNFLLDSSWEISSGVGMQYRKILLTQHKLHFPDFAGGSTYIRARFSAVDVPVLIRYKIHVGRSSLIIPSIGIVGSLFRIQSTAVGYNDLRYTGSDSLYYDIKGGGSIKNKISADPFVSLAYEKERDGLKVFGVSVFYQYTPVPIPPISFHSEFYNKSSYSLSVAELKGNLSYAGVALIYYPSFLSFRKSETDDAYDEQE